MLNQVISAVLQVAVFTLIPFLVYIFRYKRMRGFGQYVGLVPSTRKAVPYFRAVPGRRAGDGATP